MPGGRPARNAQRHEVFEPLAEWFNASLEAAGYNSINGFLTANRMLNKNLVYNLANAAKPLKLDEIRMIALALKRPLDEAETLWRKTRNEVERRANEERRTEALASWDDVPELLDPSVQDLMEAQCDTVEQLPYRKLLVEPPPLSTVYVRQQVRHEPRPDEEKDRRPTPETVTALGALDRHEHLLITGGPGTGKSTFGHYVTGLLAKRWLRTEDADPAVTEPVLPLRIPARALLGDGTWSDVLANAVDKTLGLHLTERCPPSLLANRAHGARWLLIVDGLDEITDSEARARLVTAIARHSRSGSFRFVVSTRDLPDAELAPLRGQRFGAFTMVPMSRPDLTDFAEKWFTAQDPTDGKAYAQRFLHQAADGRLRELVRNPLLATVAAVAYSREPDRPLPTNRAELYERFYDYLVDEQYSGRPAKPGWLYEHREELIAHLGRARLEDERPLLKTAMAWVGVNGSEEEVRDALISTGLFVHEGGEIRFLHHSFAEYLSAKGIAGTLTADGGEMRSLVWRWETNPSARNHILLTLSLWARKPGVDLTEFVTKGISRRPDLAGALIAEGVPMDTAVIERVVRRLGTIALAANTGFNELAAMSENRVAAEYLESITILGELSAAVRVAAAVALCHIQGLVATRDLLDLLLDNASAPDRVAIGETMLELAASEHWPDAVAVLSAVGKTGTETAVEVASLLEDYELLDEAATLIEPLLTVTGLNGFQIGVIVRIWLAVRGPERLEDLLALPSDAYGKAGLAAAIANFGYDDEAAALAKQVLADPGADGADLALALETWCRTEPDLDGTWIREALHRRTMDTSDLLSVASALDHLGFPEPAAELLASALATGLDRHTAAQFISTWLAVHGAEQAGELRSKLTAIGQPPSASIGFAEAFAESGHPEQALRLLRPLTSGSVEDGGDIAALARAWDLATNGTERDEISAWLAEHQTPGSTLIWLGETDLAIIAAKRLLAEPSPRDHGAAARILVAVDGPSAVEEVLGAIAGADDAADALAEMGRGLIEHGHLDSARELLGRLLRESDASPMEVTDLGYQFVRVGALDAVVSDLAALLADPTLPPHRRVIARATLAWLRLLRPSAPDCPNCGHSEAAPHP